MEKPINLVSVARDPRCLAATLLCLFCLCAAGCASLESPHEAGGDVDRLGARLVETAQERADLRQVRVWVAEVHETRQEAVQAGLHAANEDLIAVQLEHELVIALASRMN